MVFSVVEKISGFVKSRKMLGNIELKVEKLFPNYPEFVRREFYGLGIDNVYDFSYLFDIAIRGERSVAQGKTVKAKEGITAEDLVGKALELHERYKPQLLLWEISSKQDTVFIEQRSSCVYGVMLSDAVKRCVSEKRISVSELEDALKIPIINEGRDAYKWVMASEMNHPDYLNPEALIFGVDNGAFSEREIKNLTSRLDHGESLDEFREMYGRKPLNKVIAERILSYDHQKFLEIFKAPRGSECFESH